MFMEMIKERFEREVKERLDMDASGRVEPVELMIVGVELAAPLARKGILQVERWAQAQRLQREKRGVRFSARKWSPVDSGEPGEVIEAAEVVEPSPE